MTTCLLLLRTILSQRGMPKPGPPSRRDGFPPAAVLVPIVGEESLLLTRRTSNLSRHGGEICFPGGMHEPGDETLLDTALREGGEELGVLGRQLEVLGCLPAVISRSTGIEVTPFVAVLPSSLPIRVNEKEVAEAIHVPIPDLLGREVEIEWVAADGRVLKAWAYDYNGCRIWGLTARIIKQLFDLIVLNAEAEPEER